MDDIRPAPAGYIWAKSVEQAKTMISFAQNGFLIGLTDDIFLDLISLDHDAGDFASDGGDYIEILNWLERVQNALLGLFLVNFIFIPKILWEFKI